MYNGMMYRASRQSAPVHKVRYNTPMDAMQLAQLKRQISWHEQELKRHEMDLHTAELALEGAKKNVEELKKRLVESKHGLDLRRQELTHVEAQNKRAAATMRR